jgi:hypothetical protein
MRNPQMMTGGQVRTLMTIHHPRVGVVWTFDAPAGFGCGRFYVSYGRKWKGKMREAPPTMVAAEKGRARNLRSPSSYYSRDGSEGRDKTMVISTYVLVSTV